MLLLRMLNSPGQILYFTFPIVNIVLYLSTQIVRTKMSEEQDREWWMVIYYPKKNGDHRPHDFDFFHCSYASKQRAVLQF